MYVHLLGLHMPYYSSSSPSKDKPYQYFLIPHLNNWLDELTIIWTACSPFLNLPVHIECVHIIMILLICSAPSLCLYSMGESSLGMIYPTARLGLRLLIKVLMVAARYFAFSGAFQSLYLGRCFGRL